MKLTNKPRGRRSIIAVFLCLSLGLMFTAAQAQEKEERIVVTNDGKISSVTDTTTPTKKAETTSERVSPAAKLPTVSNFVYNADASDTANAEKKSDFVTPIGLFSKVLMFLILLTGITFALVHFAKKGKINIGALKHYSANERLIISETRMLGNRQYLMVVEYGAQKMLLSVTPGNVQHLCFLEAPFEDDVDTAIDEEYGKNETA